ncbi:hypothetical protein BTR22_05235 [Alkalihalophilus pseudofirmus]|uniref:hypothetical protein n=1 Tax=Alkalihalophilus pseudofirmus TaxID=79885 RepID=UPI000951308D|nr:hypothetical protein BTR22_05235 [Alkalihalophilus pseudofirmus]
MQGAGTQSNPYIVRTPQDIDDIRNDLSAHYELANSIDMSVFDNFNPIGSGAGELSFRGSFNGNGYAIRNLTVHATSANGSLFGSVEYSEIRNLRIEGATVTGTINTSVLSGRCLGSNLTNIFVSGTVNGTNAIGGLIGWNVTPGSFIKNCYADVDVTGNYHVGGLIGNISRNETQVDSCYAVGKVHANFNNDGGLIATFGNSHQVTNSYYDTQTTGQNSSAGGFRRTTEEMQQQSTYVSWNFENEWLIEDDYPTLRVFEVEEADQPIINIATRNIQKGISPIHLSTTTTPKVAATTRHIHLKSAISSITTHTTQSKRKIKRFSAGIEPINTHTTTGFKQSLDNIVYLNSHIQPLSTKTTISRKTKYKTNSHINLIYSRTGHSKPIDDIEVYATTSILTNHSQASIKINKSHTDTLSNRSYVEVRA